MRNPEDELDNLKNQNLLRSLPPQDNTLINFASNDYLGLANHPDLITVYRDALDQFGCGSTASRLICGNTPAHKSLETTIAEAKKTEAALSFSTGYATSVGVLTALLQKGDTVIMDKLCHASLIDGARMSNATLRVFPHNHLAKLKHLLESTQKNASITSRTLVVTESVFSMDGDLSHLAEISDLTRHFQALLMVDEAHALGVIGPTGMGLAEELDLQSKIDFHMGTLGKAAGVAGGYLAAKRIWIDLLINRARSFIYSTAPPPAQAATADAAIQLIRDTRGDELRRKLWSNIQSFQSLNQLKKLPSSAIIPWLVGSSQDALNLSSHLKDLGMLTPAIRFPTVPRNTARLRITISATHTESELTKLADALSTTR